MSDEDKNIKKYSSIKTIYICTSILIFIIYIFYFFENKCKLIIPRYNHSSVIMKDGKILITGGQNYNKRKIITLDSAEIYDPKTKKSILLKSKMKHARKGHTSILMPNGNILIIGGDKKYKSAEIYDAKTNSFQNTSIMNTAKRDVVAILINENSIFVTDIYSQAVEIYKIDKNTFSLIGTLTEPIRTTQIPEIIDDILYIPVGRTNAQNNVINYYNIRTNDIGVINRHNDLPINTDCLNNSIFIHNNKLLELCYGSNNTFIEEYILEKQKFILKSNIVDNKFFECKPLYSNGNILLFCDKLEISKKPYKYLLLYNPSNNKLNYIKKYKNIYNKSSVLINDDHLYSIGGYYDIPFIGLKKVTNVIIDKKIRSSE